MRKKSNRTINGTQNQGGIAKLASTERRINWRTLQRQRRSAEQMYAHFAHTLSYLQWVEHDAQDMPETALYFLAGLNRILNKTWKLQQQTVLLPDSVALDTHAYLRVIWNHVSHVFFKGWGPVTLITKRKVPSIGRGWNKFSVDTLPNRPDLTTFRALIRQFLDRYRVHLEIHAMKLATVGYGSNPIEQSIEIGWPYPELQRNRETGASASAESKSTTELNVKTDTTKLPANLITKAKLTKRLMERFSISDTIAYRLIASAVKNNELKPIPLTVGQSKVGYHLGEALEWLETVNYSPSPRTFD